MIKQLLQQASNLLDDIEALEMAVPLQNRHKSETSELSLLVIAQLAAVKTETALQVEDCCLGRTSKVTIRSILEVTTFTNQYVV